MDKICPFNKFKCPPKPPVGPSSASNPPQAPGLTPPPSGGQTYPSGSAGPVVVVQTPPPVVQLPRPIVTATNAAPVTTAPCNCLTKQYLQDGSVLFTDICTREAAMATPDELKAQGQAVAPTVR